MNKSKQRVSNSRPYGGSAAGRTGSGLERTAKSVAMTGQETLTALTNRFPAAQVSEFRGQTRVVVARDSVYELLACLKNERQFDFLADITCVDYLNYRDATD